MKTLAQLEKEREDEHRRMEKFWEITGKIGARVPRHLRGQELLCEGLTAEEVLKQGGYWKLSGNNGYEYPNKSKGGRFHAYITAKGNLYIHTDQLKLKGGGHISSHAGVADEKRRLQRLMPNVVLTKEEKKRSYKKFAKISKEQFEELKRENSKRKFPESWGVRIVVLGYAIVSEPIRMLVAKMRNNS